MRNELISITLSEVDGIGLLSFTSEFFYSGKLRKRLLPEDYEYLESDFVRDITIIIDSFIESFPHRQISQVGYQQRQKSPSTAVVDAVNIHTDTLFEFHYGSWFVCSENPLDLTFEEHNELLGYYAKIPSGNWRGGFARWAATALQSTKAACFGIMDEDNSYLTVCFWPVEAKVIESHLEPIMKKHGLKISKQNC